MADDYKYSISLPIGEAERLFAPPRFGELIRCVDRMPESQKSVLVYDADREEWSVAEWCPESRGVSKWSACCGIEGWEWEFYLTPTHWMPLPELPK